MKDIRLLDEKPRMDSYLTQASRPLSSFSFVSLFAWCDFFDFEFKIINGCLCIFAHGEGGTFLYLPPLGKSFDGATVESAFTYMTQGKTPRPVNRIENICGNLLSAFDGGCYNQYSKPSEYVYRKEDLISLKGNAYKSQRHDCNCFMARFPTHSFEAYAEADFDACMDLYGRWSAGRAAANSDGVYRSMLEENRKVHARLLGFIKPLDVVARVLKVDGKLIGYTFGYPLDGETFCVYAEIADLAMTGSAAFMFRSFCADAALKGFSKINAMDDFAMPQVALAKKAYHPSELVASYTVSLKNQHGH